MTRALAALRRHLPGGRRRALEAVVEHGYHAGWHDGTQTECEGASCARWPLSRS